MAEKVRTSLDAGVLIAAARGIGDQHRRAMAVLDDADREFVASDFLALEVIPKALYNRHHAETEFYDVFFSNIVVEMAKVSDLIEEAHHEARTNGLSAVDALHVVASAALGAAELITTEKPTKPMHRTTLVKVTTL